MVKTTPILATVLSSLLATIAAASGGRLELSQAQADAGGFPIVISQPGSYVLTSDLVVPTADTTAISVTANRVSIDLNGFSIEGPGGSGSGIGIEADDNLTVRNGRIRFMGRHGIDAQWGATIVDVDIIGSGQHGVRFRGDALLQRVSVLDGGQCGLFGSTGDNSLVLESRFHGNGWCGVAMGFGVVADTTASSNGIVSGITATGVVVNATVHDNDAEGVRLGDGSLFASGSVEGSSVEGLDGRDGTLVLDSTFRANGVGANAAGVQFSTLVLQSAFRENDEGVSGVEAHAYSTYRQQNDFDVTAGTVSVEGNVCSASLCP